MKEKKKTIRWMIADIFFT